jgi:catechol 2,3-dioxygenase-like lactoylglutathione lyase family enzyme
MQVGIVPGDLARSLSFYRDVLRLTARTPQPVMAGRVLHPFDVDGAVIKLIELGPDDGKPAVRAGAAPFLSATGLRWLTLDVDDLDAVVARADAARALWQLRPQELRPGLRVAIVEDPDGNAVELVEKKG